MNSIITSILFLTLTSASAFAPLKINGEANKIAVSSIEAKSIFGGWWDDSDGDASWVNQGVMVNVPKQTWNYEAQLPSTFASPSFKRNFSLVDNEAISFRISANFYDEDGNVITQSVNDGGGAFNIAVYNAANEQKISTLRIWVNSQPNGADQNTQLWATVNGDDWQYSVSGERWIKGTAKLSSSFYIQFDKENLFSSYVGGSDSITPLATNIDYVNAVKNNLEGVDEVFFRFGASNGFTEDASLVISEINGQALTNVDGVINDVSAPKFSTKNNLPATLPVNVPVALNIEAFDLLDSNLKYQVKYGEDEFKDGLTFTPLVVGDDSVTIKAIDSSNNETTYTYNFKGVNVAESFAETFLNTTSVCDPSGVTNNITSEMWQELEDAYNALSVEERARLSNAQNNEHGTKLEKAVARYEYIVHKYGYKDFMDRNVEVLSINNLNNHDEVWFLPLIISLSVITLFAVVVLVVKTRKKDKIE